MGHLSSTAYLGIGLAAFWGLRHWVICHPPPILESVLRHVGVCGIGSFVVHRLFWNRSCGILGFVGLGLLLSIAYFGIGPAAFWVLRDWVSCRPSPILESVLRHFGYCGIGSFVVHRLFWNRSCGILGFAGLGLLSSTAYFGIGPAAFWGLRHWVFCHPPPILESVLRHFGVCGIGSFVILRLFWNRSCGILGFAALGLLSSSAYFGIGPAA